MKDCAPRASSPRPLRHRRRWRSCGCSPGFAALTLGIALLTAQGAIFKRLTAYGNAYMQRTGAVLNPISSCNVLFVGNLCATITNVILHWRQLTPTALRTVANATPGGGGGRRVLLTLLLLTLAYSAAQFTQYTALEHADKNYLVALALVGELEPVFELAATTLCLRERKAACTLTSGASSLLSG